ncbi:hypothetical protein EVAR_18946_1 [Eumeta japonica]|uniref:Uncharacterized protein n=1 Tax=Eumeta variegata TaxID=151549 RepID=A0A4C1V1X3_EUMVA|nr:hypothetical protein EVAR_18946_1 [Eumeta japonica]
MAIRFPTSAIVIQSIGCDTTVDRINAHNCDRKKYTSFKVERLERQPSRRSVHAHASTKPTLATAQTARNAVQQTVGPQHGVCRRGGTGHNRPRHARPGRRVVEPRPLTRALGGGAVAAAGMCSSWATSALRLYKSMHLPAASLHGF